MSNSYSNMISFSFGLPRLSFGWGGAPSISIPRVATHDVETAAEKRARSVKHFLNLNHVNHAILYHNLQYHNHTSHILAAAYILGASSEHLGNIYEKESQELEPWQDSPGEISEDDWREYLGKREYQRAYVDFFEDQLVQFNYDWQELVQKFLLDGKEPLINNLIAGLGHPLIHLAYAYEVSSRTVAIESLAMTACCYNFLHKYFDDPSYTQPSTYSTNSPLEILEKVRQDSRFDGVFQHQAGSIEELLSSHESAVLEHWNAWNISDPRAQFEASQRAAVALLVGSEQKDGKYDFFLVHLLTTSHAVRVVLPLIPAKFQIPLVRQWWLFTLVVYITQLRPVVSVDKIDDVDLKGREWKFVVDQALKSNQSMDPHYVKALRVIQEANTTWGDESQFFIKAALKFATEFNGWGGFGNLTADDFR